MGRYYKISLTPPPPLGSAPGTASAAPTKVWTSYPDGQFNPRALNVQFDLLSSVYAIPNGDVGNSTITVEGIALSDLQQAAQYGSYFKGSTLIPGMHITVEGGMGEQGLPLTNPLQKGVLLQGLIYQSFGNWIETEMNLNFVVIAAKYTFAAPGNFVFQWLPGQSLASSLQTCLERAYPNDQVIIKIGDQYVTTYPVNWYSHTFKQVAQWLRSYTMKDSPSGQGVDMQINNGVISVTDGSKRSSPITINFTDFIGQPKWVNPNTLEFTTVMRADIQIPAQVQMQPGLPNAPGAVTTVGDSLPSQQKYKTSFQGKFDIRSVRHVGNFRDNDGSAWISIFQATPQVQ